MPSVLKFQADNMKGINVSAEKPQKHQASLTLTPVVKRRPLIFSGFHQHLKGKRLVDETDAFKRRQVCGIDWFEHKIVQE